MEKVLFKVGLFFCLKQNAESQGTPGPKATLPQEIAALVLRNYYPPSFPNKALLRPYFPGQVPLNFHDLTL